MLPVRVTHPFKDCGLLGAIRKHDIHTGLDLYCNEGEPVVCTEGGFVVSVFQFTGEQVGTPWWNSTHAVVVRTNHYTYVYGEVIPCVEAGDTITKGSVIGHVTPVLKVDKGITPMNMLHLEVWKNSGYIENFVWNKGETKPDALLNPLDFIGERTDKLLLTKTKCGYKLESNSGEYLRFFTMAADSKAFLLDDEYIFLTKKSPIEDKIMYTVSTGKSLWFD